MSKCKLENNYILNVLNNKSKHQLLINSNDKKSTKKISRNPYDDNLKNDEPLNKSRRKKNDKFGKQRRAYFCSLSFTDSD